MPKKLITTPIANKKGSKPFIVLVKDSMMVTVFSTSPIFPTYARKAQNEATSPRSIVNPAIPKKKLELTGRTESTDIVISKNGSNPVIAIVSPYIIRLVFSTFPINPITAQSAPNAAIIPIIEVKATIASRILLVTSILESKNAIAVANRESELIVPTKPNKAPELSLAI
jgi:hypothetical protein